MKHLLAELLATRSPNTVQVLHAVISGIFTEANELGYLDQNPARGLLRRLLPAKKRRVQTPLTPSPRRIWRCFSRKPGKSSHRSWP